MKKLINVLWAIEKDIHVIASNTKVSKKFVAEDSGSKKIASNMEALLNRKALFSATRETPSAFELKTSLYRKLPKESEKDPD